MNVNPQKRSISETAELRKGAGQWLKERREARGLSQRQFAQSIGVEYYTFISQLETGRGRIPPDRFRTWAQALGMDTRDFVLALSSGLSEDERLSRTKTGRPRERSDDAGFGGGLKRNKHGTA